MAEMQPQKYVHVKFDLRLFDWQMCQQIKANVR